MHGIKQKLAATLHKLVPGLITGAADDDGRSAMVAMLVTMSRLRADDIVAML
jgi:hypothetical protein